MFEEWEDFEIGFGPFGVALGAGRVRYRSTEKSHVLPIRLGAEVQKRDIKVH